MYNVNAAAADTVDSADSYFYCTTLMHCSLVLLYRNYYRNKDPDYEDYELDRSHVTFRPNGYAVRKK